MGRRGQRRMVVREAPSLFQEARNRLGLRRSVPRQRRPDPGAARQERCLGPNRGGLLRGVPPGWFPRRPRHESPRHHRGRAEAGQLHRWAPHQHGGRLSEPEPGTRQPDYTSERAGPPDSLRRAAGRWRGDRRRRPAPQRAGRRGHRVRGGYRVALPAGEIRRRARRTSPGNRRASGAGVARSRRPTCETTRRWRRNSASGRRRERKGRRRSSSSVICRRGRTTATASPSRRW